MSGITIIDAKIVGMCSKHRKEGDEILKDKKGRIYEDSEISCIECACGGDEHTKPKTEISHQCFICPYCYDDHDNNTRCKSSFDNGTKKEREEILKLIDEDLSINYAVPRSIDLFKKKLKNAIGEKR